MKKRWCVTGTVCEKYLVWHRLHRFEGQLPEDEITSLVSLPQDGLEHFPLLIISGAYFLWLTNKPRPDGVVVVRYENGTKIPILFVSDAKELDTVISQATEGKALQEYAGTPWSVWYARRSTLPTAEALQIAFATKIESVNDKRVQSGEEKEGPSQQFLATTQRTPLKQLGKYWGSVL